MIGVEAAGLAVEFADYFGPIVLQELADPGVALGAWQAHSDCSIQLAPFQHSNRVAG